MDLNCPDDEEGKPADSFVGFLLELDSMGSSLGGSFRKCVLGASALLLRSLPCKQKRYFGTLHLTFEHTTMIGKTPTHPTIQQRVNDSAIQPSPVVLLPMSCS